MTLRKSSLIGTPTLRVKAERKDCEIYMIYVLVCIEFLYVVYV